MSNICLPKFWNDAILKSASKSTDLSTTGKNCAGKEVYKGLCYQDLKAA